MKAEKKGSWETFVLKDSRRMMKLKTQKALNETECNQKDSIEGVAIETKAIKQMRDANCIKYMAVLESDWSKRCVRLGIICQYDQVDSVNVTKSNPNLCGQVNKPA